MKKTKSGDFVPSMLGAGDDTASFNYAFDDTARAIDSDLPDAAQCADIRGTLTRRGFLSGLAIGGVALAGGLVGCAPSNVSSDADSVDANAEGSSSQDTSEASVAPMDIVETVDADIVVVGAGISGLACAVQAGQDGNAVMLLEKSGEVGGNGMGTEGIFAVNSKMQQEKGIKIDPVDIVAKELEEAQYRVDGSLWMDMIEKSAENIEWLQSCGVGFNGVVDNYSAGGLYSTMHWWEGEAGAVGYVPPMRAAAEAAGVDIRTDTAGTQLIMDGEKVVGLYAKSDKGTIQINAKAVVLASGGIGGNKELLVKQGWDQEKVDEMIFQCVPTVEGDGYTMAMAVGAKDYLSNSADQVFNAIAAFGTDTTPPYNSPLNGGFGLTSMGPTLWVNQDADRFTPEDIGYINMAAQATACKGNRETFAIFDQALLDQCTQDPADAELAQKALADGDTDSLCKGDDFKTLAEHFKLDVENLQSTVDRYNSLCLAEADTDFGKRAEYMQPLVNGPFYMAKIVPLLVVVDGGIMTNKKTEVLDTSLRPIAGLYAVGLDGAMLWRNVYTQNMPGTQMGNNVNSGRNAARSAMAYIKGV